MRVNLFFQREREREKKKEYVACPVTPKCKALLASPRIRKIQLSHLRSARKGRKRNKEKKREKETKYRRQRG